MSAAFMNTRAPNNRQCGRASLHCNFADKGNASPRGRARGPRVTEVRDEWTVADIDPVFGEEFFSHPAISYEHQPNLRELFERLTDSDDRFTIVVGAGVSLDAGLPSWPKLIDNIVELIDEEKWRRESRLDATDLQR